MKLQHHISFLPANELSKSRFATLKFHCFNKETPVDAGSIYTALSPRVNPACVSELQFKHNYPILIYVCFKLQARCICKVSHLNSALPFTLLKYQLSKLLKK